MLRQHLHILPPFNERNGKIWFLIDGQQRLSVLHHAACGASQQNGNGQAVEFERLTFCVDSSHDSAEAFTYRVPVPGQFVSARDILHPQWRKKLNDCGQLKLKRVERCRSTLLKYKVPLILVEGDREDIRELFVRINSTGTPLASADRAFAFASRMDFRDKAHQIRDKLPEPFRELPFETILQAFAFTVGGIHGSAVEVGERAYEAAIQRWERAIAKNNAELPRLTKLLKQLGEAVHDAVTYLTRFGVLDSSMLPSANMVATLAVFFFHHSKLPTLKQRRQIQRWFWATGVGQRYSGRGFRQNIQNDVRFFEQLARGYRQFGISGGLVERSDVVNCDYARRSSLANSFFCLLALQKPQYLENGQPLPDEKFATAQNRKDRHHIFPKKLCNNHGIGHKQYNSICNICFLITKENKSFAAKQPRDYLMEFSGKQHFRRALKSHMIPCGQDSGLWVKDVKKALRMFLQQRRDLICKAFESQADQKLFR